jgi:hypothetical protein
MEPPPPSIRSAAPMARPNGIAAVVIAPIGR